MNVSEKLKKNKFSLLNLYRLKGAALQDIFFLLSPPPPSHLPAEETFILSFNLPRLP